MHFHGAGYAWRDHLGANHDQGDISLVYVLHRLDFKRPAFEREPRSRRNLRMESGTDKMRGRGQDGTGRDAFEISGRGRLNRGVNHRRRSRDVARHKSAIAIRRIAARITHGHLVSIGSDRHNSRKRRIAEPRQFPPDGVPDFLIRSIHAVIVAAMFVHRGQ